MLSTRDLGAAVSVHDGTILPRYLGPADDAWLRALVDEYDRAVGRPRRFLDERLGEPLRSPAPEAKKKVAARVLDAHYAPVTSAAVPPRTARAAAFAAAAASAGLGRDAALALAASNFGVTPDALAASLFADVGPERVVAAPERPLGPSEVALRANLAIAQSLLRRASTVRIAVAGEARALVRHARLRGLMCSVLPRGASEAVVIELSGPFSLFRRTLLYGRALAGIVPRLLKSNRFRLEAECHLFGDRPLAFEIRPGDPLFSADVECPRFDSRLEERFAREFARIAPDWDVLREPEPVRAGPSLVFPDFALEHRRDRSRRFLVEIAGFWTRDYIVRKLAALREAAIENLILCLDAERNCASDELPRGARVILYRRHVDADAVRRIVEADST